MFQSKRFPLKSLAIFSKSLSSLTDDEKKNIQIIEYQNFSLKDFDKLYNLLLKTDKYSFYCGLIGLRRITSELENFEFFNSPEVICLLIRIASNESDQYAQYESLWILSNLASGEGKLIETMTLNGVLIVVIKTLDHENEEVKMQALWCLSNIISDNQKYRDCLINVGIIDKLLLIINNCSKDCKEIVIWTIANIFRVKPWLEWELFLKVFGDLLSIIKDEKEISENLTNALSLLYVYSSKII